MRNIPLHIHANVDITPKSRLQNTCCFNTV